MFYLIDYPLFARCKEGKMGIPTPIDESEPSLHDRVKLREYEIWINGNPMTVHCYSMNHALKLASNLPLTNDDVVKVLFL